MKGKYGGPLPIEDLFQALWQDRQFFDRHGITHVKATYLYFTPCDETGQTVLVGDSRGEPIDGFVSSGGYRAAADSYERVDLEPRCIARAPKTYSPR